MENVFNGSDLNQKTIFDHPSGLFVLFFTEMWERFSYYGMRAILVLFLTASLLDEGWGWERKDAMILYGWYTMLVYFTPLIGGILADKLLGYRNAVVIGAFLMALGHASLALESMEQGFFYLGLILLIAGNGLFKPNISSIVGQLYKPDDSRIDGAYTIFYMGINAGAFLGILLCGYLGEKEGWHYGFGLAGIFMFFGMLQFFFAQNIFGSIGTKPKVQKKSFIEINIFSAMSVVWQYIVYGFENAGRLAYLIIGIISCLIALVFGIFLGPFAFVLLTLIWYFILVFAKNLTAIEIDRIIVILIFSASTVFFWWAFEQAGGSMTIFAKDYTNRELSGNSADIFNTINTIITLVPMIIVTYVLFKLFQNTFKKYFISNIFLGLSFVIIWCIVYYMLNAEIGQETSEIPASWFSVLNSLFIILLAPVFSKIWASKYNPSGPKKFGIGLILLGVGYLFVAYGSMGIPAGAQTASVSIMWLVYAYLFHTLGELCLSPVGLSYVSKLAPVRLIGIMFGFWLLSSAVANGFAGWTGSYINDISSAIGLNGFFGIFALVPIGAGLIMFLLNSFIKRKMHGIK